MCHFHSGPQHEAMRCHVKRFRYGAHRTDDPRSGGSSEDWLRKTNLFTCNMGLDMRRSTGTQHNYHTARAQQVTHGGVDHQKTG